MATCDPKLLPGLATCFHCADPGTRKEIQLYLLGQLIGGASAPSLSAGAATYRPLQNKLAMAAEVYLLAVITGNSTVPSTLEKLAACWWCIPKSERLDVSTYLLASSVGGSTDPKVLEKSAAPYRPLIPVYDQVKLYVFNTLAGTLSLKTIMAGAACLMCLDSGRLEEIYLYLICQGLMAGNIVPPGSSYGPGGSPEFDLTVLSFTTYTIMWGANDLFVTICGVRYDSTGPGTTIIVFTKNCTLMKFFGTFAGTTVTAKVAPNPAHPVPATPTGFTWAISGANAVATWNAPPAGVTKTELWTSPDNITFTLASTVAAPGTTGSVAAPATGVLLYAEIRFVDSQNAYSTFTAALSVTGFDAVVPDWVSRVIANGGATPSANTQSALNTFVTTLKGGANVWGKILSCNVVAPDNLIAARTPFIKGVGTGNDPWTNNNFVLADLTVNGLVGNGTNKYMDTGLIGDTLGMLTNSSGLVVYVSADDATGTQGEIGVYNAGGTNAFTGLNSHTNATLTFGNLYRTDTGKVNWTPPASPAGFYSLQRTGATTLNIYFASSGQAHGSLANDATTPIGAPPHNFSLIAWANGNGAGGAQDFTKKRLSFVAVTLGLSSADDATLFNAVQALRTAFGGGFV